MSLDGHVVSRSCRWYIVSLVGTIVRWTTTASIRCSVLSLGGPLLVVDWSCHWLVLLYVDSALSFVPTNSRVKNKIKTLQN